MLLPLLGTTPRSKVKPSAQPHERIYHTQEKNISVIQQNGQNIKSNTWPESGKGL